MSRTRKPADRRQNRATADIGLVVAHARSAPPAPHPSTRKPLLAATVEAWDAFWSSKLSSLVDDADLPALRRLFRMYDERERLDRSYRAQRFVEGGATGKAIVVHPAAGQISSLDARITALEDRFGLTPLARLKLGLTLGAAARSLEDFNREFDEDEAGEEDPRLRSIDVREAR